MKKSIIKPKPPVLFQASSTSTKLYHFLTPARLKGLRAFGKWFNDGASKDEVRATLYTSLWNSMLFHLPNSVNFDPFDSRVHDGVSVFWRTGELPSACPGDMRGVVSLLQSIGELTAMIVNGLGAIKHNPDSLVLKVTTTEGESLLMPPKLAYFIKVALKSNNGQFGLAYNAIVDFANALTVLDADAKNCSLQYKDTLVHVGNVAHSYLSYLL